MTASVHKSARTRIKVCGLTQVDNALAVEACGVDAIGLVFYPSSSRCVAIEQAARVARALGPLTQRIGLFVDADADQVRAVLAQVPLSGLQFHGAEDNDFCGQFGVPWFKALRMKPGFDPVAAMAAYPDAAGFLLDAYQPGIPGGTGARFDWARVPVSAGRPLLLAGGLDPDNVGQAIAQTGVYGVDLSGGVESAPGLKDPARVAALVQAVARADARRWQ